MSDEVAQVKAKTDIVALINRYVPLKKRGRHFISRCPFHSEKSGSFMVSPELQIYKCFGCGKSGDVFSFLEEYEKLDFKEALHMLAKEAKIELTQSFGPQDNKNTLFSINTQLAKFYHHLLLNHPIGKPALDYLTSRHISAKTIKTYQIGFAPGDSSSAKYLLKQGFLPKDLIATGTFNASSYSRFPYDRFAGRLVFPLYDHRDRILGFSGRILPGTDSAKHAKYINSPQTELYNKSQHVFGLNIAKDAIRKEKSVLVVEGEFDAISPHQAGFQNIIAIKGTAFTSDQLQLLKRYTEKIILALDADFAGNNAALKSIQMADEMGFEVVVLDLQDKFKDPDEAILGDKDFFQKQLDTALPIWDFVINTSLKTHNISTPHGKKQTLAQVLPFLSAISNEVLKSEYLKKFASVLGVDIQAVTAEANKQLTTPVTNSAPSANISSSKEQELLRLLLSTKDPAKVSAKLLANLPTLHDPLLQKIYQELANYQNPTQFQALLPPEIKPTYEQLFLQASLIEFDGEQKANQISALVNLLAHQNLQDEIKEVSAKIAQAETLNQEDKLPELEKQYKQLLVKLSQLDTKS